MRKVIAVDNTFLMGKYDGILLIAMEHDTKSHISPPLAAYVVSSECDDSWNFFFQNLLNIPNNPDLCIISDRHNIIAKAAREVYVGKNNNPAQK